MLSNARLETNPGVTFAQTCQSSARGDVSERAVAIVFEKVGHRFLPLGETFEPPAVDKKNVEPAIVVVVIECDAAAGGFEEIFVFVLAAIDGFCVETGFFGDVEKIYTERRGFRARGLRLSV